MTIAEAIRLMSTRGNSVQHFSAKVVSVNADKASCVLEVLGEGPQLEDVRLTAIIPEQGNAKGWRLIPKVDSIVVAAVLDGDAAVCVVMSTSELDEARMNVPKTVWNGGNNEGMVKAPYLEQRLQAIEAAIEQLVNDHNFHTHNVAGVMAGPASLPTLFPNGSSTADPGTTDGDSLRNPDFTH